MKKVIAIMLVFSMCFTLFSCKEADEDTAKPLDISQSENTEGAPNVNEQESKPEIEVPRYTIEDNFSSYEVIVTLTKQETDLKKEYTEKDFPNADVFYVVQNQDYYGNPNFKDAYPEYQDKTTLFMYLNTPSKQNVLDTIEKLKQDERVFDADVCVKQGENELLIYFTDDFLKSGEIAKLDSFKECNVERIDLYPRYPCAERNPDDMSSLLFEEGEKGIQDCYNAIRVLKEDKRIKKVKPYYPQEHYEGPLGVIISDPEWTEEKEYTPEDFPEITELKIKFIVSDSYDKGKTTSLRFVFENPTYDKLIKIEEKLKTISKYLVVSLEQMEYGRVDI